MITSGSHGSSTIYRHDHFTLIGYSLQQALFRRSDRRRVQQFLFSTGFRAGDDFEPAELRRTLRVWAGRHVGCERLRRLASDANLAKYCEELLSHVARVWDGLLRDAKSGMALSRLRLVMETKPTLALGVVASWDERMPRQCSARLNEVSIKLSEWEGRYFEPLPLPLSASELVGADTWSIQTDELTFAFDNSDVYALAYDVDYGAWVQADNIQFGETYQLWSKVPLTSK